MKIWRYLTIDKFKRMLRDEAIFIARSDQFSDRFEGSYPTRDVKKIDRIYDDPAMFRAWRKFVAASCWHKNEYESDGMWQLYSDRKKGVAIQSTIESLEKLCSDHAYVTEVKYIDYENDEFPDQLIIRPFKYKRIFYKHEQEVRAIIWSLPPAKEIKNGFPEVGTPNAKSDIPIPGLNIEVDLKLLIKAIVVSPESNEDQYQQVEALLKEYNFDDIVLKKSDLSGDPVW